MRRRSFALGTASAAAIGSIGTAQKASAARPGYRVAVFGGGVGGMSAAHELAERGFQVDVYEKRSIPGGKARSIPVPGSGREGRRDLPGEHGFRFFPGFYKHLPDTMKRIPYARNANGVFDNLVEARELSFSVAGGRRDIELSLASPLSLEGIAAHLRTLMGELPNLTLEEAANFARRMLQFMTSCDDRRFGDYENRAWWEFVDAERYSAEYRRFLAVGLTRNLVAARAEEINARTVGMILTQFLIGGEAPDRLLDGPTNEVWIDPWLSHLETMGVRYRRNAVVERIRMSGGRISSVEVRIGGELVAVTADHYVFALPLDVMLPLLNRNVLTADPRLNDLFALRTAWMNGLQIYFDRDVPLVHGHSIYLDSPWALTSVSQQQFWRDFSLRNYGDGTVRGVLSIDISNFDDPGILYRKAAKDCTEQEIFEEVWAQLESSLNDAGIAELNRDWIVDWFLDPSLVFGPNGTPRNEEPLLINTAGTYSLRPDGWTAIENMYLASDFVKCNVDLASMEAANEAGRQATNAILDRTGSWASHCRIWPMKEPAALGIAKLEDQVRWWAGAPHALA